MKKNIISTFLILTSCFTINFAKADIEISEPILVFKNNENTVKNIKVINHDTENKAYVQVELYEIQNAGTDKQSRILFSQNQNKINDENLTIKHPKESQLIFSPQKMVLNPKGTPVSSTVIHLINNYKELNEEKVFRLRVYPVINGFEKDDKSNMGIKILMGYESLIFIEPNKIKEKYDFEIKENKLIAKNYGNINYKIVDLRYCLKDKCDTQGNTRVYRNSEKEIEIKGEFDRISFQKISSVGKKEEINLNK